MVLDKDDNNLYPFTKLGFDLTNLNEEHDDTRKPLTLFIPPTCDHETSHGVDLDRPVTPVDEQVKAPPGTFSGLAKLVRRRIMAKPEAKHMTVEDQQSLAAVIMGEVNGIWPVYRQQVADPFMSTEENRELQRRITVHIVTVCEQLFYHYMDKAQILNRRGIFSGPANMSRLKAQLGLDANKFLNVLTIRRYIGEDMRSHGLVASSRQIPEGTKPITTKIPPAHQPLLSYKGLVEVSRPKTQPTSRPMLTIAEEIQEIQNNIPIWDTAKLASLVDDFQYERESFSRLSDFENVPSRKRKSKTKETVIERKTSEDISKARVLLKRADSLPGLYQGDLLEELGMDDAGGRKSAMSVTGIGDGAVETNTSRVKRPNLDDSVKSVREKAVSGSREYAANDLQKLVKRYADDTGKDDEGLPPLIQAITLSAKHDGKAQYLKKKLKMLEEQEEEYRKSQCVPVEQPEYPQPATVCTIISNKMTVRTSDIRVSDRVCLSSLTLDKYSTVYNDLIDEIDAATVKTLDSNLFLGDEITEVYSEIMKTVPTDHLLLENDPVIESAANKVNLTAAMASSTLNKKQSDRVINQSLNKATEPPWGLQSPSEWAKGPHQLNINEFKKIGLLDDVIPAYETENGLVTSTMEQTKPKDSVPTHMQDFMARSYASWLAWWKNTINSDDYMKYLSAQETDYMGVVFHFYNSDDEDEDSCDEDGRASAKQTGKAAQLNERERKLEDLKNQKTVYTPGLWNVNTVLMGGLGNAPVLGEDETEQMSKVLSATELTNTSKTPRSKAKVMSRRTNRVSDSYAEGDEALGRKTAVSFDTRAPTSMSKRTQGTKSNLDSKSRDGGFDSDLNAQDKLEKVWSMLGMPDASKLDMAIKYSSDRYHSILSDAIAEWERATRLILKRESLIAKLESFERSASDPNRFFEKGNRGSSVARLEEAKVRSELYKRIDRVEVHLKKLLEKIQDSYQDNISYQGRPYLEKMKWDRTEMLFWLQEERKQQALDIEAQIKQFGSALNTNIIHLEPITPFSVS